MVAPATTEMLRREEVEALTGLRRSTLYGLIKNKKFPAPYPLTESGRAVGWLRSEVEAYLHTRIAARQNIGGA